MDVLLRDVAQQDGVDVRGVLDVERHARRRHEVVEGFENLEHAATVAHALRLEGGRDGQAYGLVRAFGVGDHQIGRHRIETAFDAFHRGVERFQVYAEIRASFVMRAAFPGTVHSRPLIRTNVLYS